MTIPTRKNGEIIYAAHMNTLKAAIEELQANPVEITNDYVAENTYRLIVADPASNTIQITLPDATLNSGKRYIVKTSETGATYDLSFAVTITSVSSIDGQASVTVEENNQSLTLRSTGTQWVLI